MAELIPDVTSEAGPARAPGPASASARSRVWLFLAFAGVALVLSIPALSSRSYNSDEAYLATQAQALNRGAHLYIDTVDRKPPVVPYLYAAIFRVTRSDDIRPVRIVMILTNALTALLIAVEAERRFGNRRAGVIAGLLFAGSAAAFLAKDGQTANFEVFMLPTMVAAFLLAWRDKPLSSGVALSLSTLTKQTAAVTLLPLVWIVWRLRDRSSRGRGLALLGVGMVAPLLLSALVFGVQPFVHWVFTSNDAYLDVNGVEGFVVKLLFSQSKYFVLSHLALVALVVWAWRNHREDGDLWLWLLSGLVAVASGFRFFGHYFLQLLPPLCLLGTRPLLHASKRMLTVVAAVMLASVIWFAFPALTETTGVTERTATDLAAYVRRHTATGSRILVWGHLPEVYWWSDRPPATRFATTGFVTGLSGGRPASRVGKQYASPEAWQDFDADLRQHPPVLIFDLAPANIRNAGTAPPERFPEFDSFLDRGYERIATIDEVVVYAPR